MDPGFFFGGGGGGGGGSMMDNAFFLFIFILQFIEGVQYFSKDQEGSNIFQAGGGGGGCPTFSREGGS